MGYLTGEELRQALGLGGGDSLRGCPTCAVCGKLVDSVAVFEDLRRGRMGSLVIVAQCHGEQEEAVVPVELLESLDDPSSFNLNGRAFVPKAGALPPPLPGLLEGEDGGAR